MNVTLPVSVVIAQWVALFALGLLVTVMYRQLAVLLDLKQHAHRDAASIHGGLGVGALAPPFSGIVVSPDRETEITYEPDSAGHRTLLVFADPLCGSCERAVIALNELVASGRIGSGPFAAYILSIDEPPIIRAVDAFRTSTVPIVHIERHVALEAFNVRATPFFYVVGDDGRVLASGAAYDTRTILAILQEAERHAREPALQPIPIVAYETVAVGSGGGHHGHQHAEG